MKLWRKWIIGAGGFLIVVGLLMAVTHTVTLLNVSSDAVVLVGALLVILEGSAIGWVVAWVCKEELR